MLQLIADSFLVLSISYLLCIVLDFIKVMYHFQCESALWKYLIDYGEEESHFSDAIRVHQNKRKTICNFYTRN